MIAIIVVILAQPQSQLESQIERTYFYTRDFDSKLGKIDEKLDGLVEQSVRLSERTAAINERITKIETTVDTLKSWKELLEGKMSIIIFLVSGGTGVTVMIGNRVWAKHDKRKGKG